ncbi:hypothetical protein CRG98_025325 [Punica granatum]|uniref:non-specific serine/threonine protein kinase n=1 Tax=Punica granatum TaxID=22663 RepID=A0A2I0JDE1_PUNGR|nr:hypothetical protein CRG98_025325 [Punica granatum]
MPRNRLKLIVSALICFAAFAVEAAQLPDDEVQALKDIATALKKRSWDLSLDPCNRTAPWVVSASDDAVTCDCTFSNNTVCHVTSIPGPPENIIRDHSTAQAQFIDFGLAYFVLLDGPLGYGPEGQSLQGTLPPDFVRLPYLQNLDLTRNYLDGTIPSEWSSMANFLTREQIEWLVPQRDREHIHPPELSVSGKGLSGADSFWYWSFRKLNRLISNWKPTYGPSTLLDYEFWDGQEKAQSIWCLSAINCPTASNRGLYNLGINCGGSAVSIGSTSYNNDGVDGGPAYYKLGEGYWAYSSTGHFMDNGTIAEIYTVTNTSTLLTETPQLYMAALGSPVSLTYYSFCLMNGTYNVSLHFAEIVFTADRNYGSLRRRYFDIFIQGKLELKDFNIEDAVGGVGKPIGKNFTTTVTGSTLEIRLQWAGRGTTAIPYKGVYGPLISAITAENTGPEEHQLKLDWRTRHRICVGIARGLAFLHKESRLKVLHQDIKATNILLDKNLNPKISDFGLAKLDDEDGTHISTRIAGTHGHMAPEYAMHGYLTEKAEVYSFGIVALEIVSGRSNTSHKLKGECLYLLSWVME